MMQIVRTVAAIAVFGVLLPFPSCSLAQQTPAQQPPMQQPPAQQTNLNDTQLRLFAKVYVQLDKIHQAYEPKLKEAKTPEEANQIRDEAISKMKEAITQQMDEQTYNKIVEIANADNGVRQKIIGFMNEERQKP